MKASHGEGLASHTGPKSCIAGREAGDEALAGARAGRASSREMENPPRGGYFGVPTLISPSGRPHSRHRYREMAMDPARSETPCMYGTFLDGNRESPGVSAP